MKKKSRAVSNIFIIFALIGILFFIVGIVALVWGIRFRQNAVEVTAVITEIDTYRDADGGIGHRVYVDYSYGGNTYQDMPLSEYNSGMYQGKEIELLVDPQNPGKISTASGRIIIAVICIGMGAVFALTGICPTVSGKRKKARNQKLIAEGRSLFATVDRIEINPSCSVNGEHPFVVYCSYKDEYKDIIYRFKSGNLWVDPSQVIQPGSEIRVYVEGEDFSRYHVDTESLLEGKIVDYT